MGRSGSGNDGSRFPVDGAVEPCIDLNFRSCLSEGKSFWFSSNLAPWKSSSFNSGRCDTLSAKGFAFQMDDSKFFEAAQALAQGLSQWDLLIIAGSMVIIVSTSYYRPRTRKMRLAYFLFLPSWILLALSIYRGIEVQGSYVAYLVAARTNNTQRIGGIADKMNDDTVSQILFLKLALACLAVWLIIYIFWWVLSEKLHEENPK